METRSTRTTVTFNRPFVIEHHSGALPAGSYEVFTEEMLLEGEGFLTYLHTATYLKIGPSGRDAGLSELCPICEADLERVLAHQQSRRLMAAGRPV